MQAYEILLWFGGGVVLLVLLLGALSTARFYRHEQFVCPKCSYPFQPRVRKYLFSQNAAGGKILTCPNCGAKEYMEPQRRDGSK